MDREKIKRGGVIIEGIDIMEVISFLNNKNSKYLAMLLNDVEDTIPPESKEYKQIRKVILDRFNQYTRSIVEVLFSDQLEK